MAKKNKEERIVEEVVENVEPSKPKKEYNGDLRGFKTFEEMVNYPNTEEFKKLDAGCQAEYKNWLKNIL